MKVSLRITLIYVKGYWCSWDVSMGFWSFFPLLSYRGSLISVFIWIYCLFRTQLMKKCCFSICFTWFLSYIFFFYNKKALVMIILTCFFILYCRILLILCLWFYSVFLCLFLLITFMCWVHKYTFLFIFYIFWSFLFFNVSSATFIL